MKISMDKTISYFRTMSESKFQLIISFLATIFGVTVVLFSIDLYIILSVLALIIQTTMYYKKKG